MKRTDILTPVGIVLGFILIGYGIVSTADFASFVRFINIPGLIIVFGGVTAAILVNFNIDQVKQTGLVVREALSQGEYRLEDLIQLFEDLSEKARRDGLLSLENELGNLKDAFVKKGILLAIDGIEPEVIHDIMEAEITAMEERHQKGRLILEKAGEYAPAWGMIGTLIGLVLMLNDLDDPSVLGPQMSVTLITTFYGTMLANLVCLPMASKLESKSNEEAFMKQIIIEGVIGIQSGQNPRILKEKLVAFLPSKARDKIKSERNDSDLEGVRDAAS